ncbi:MAG: hypothetical protein PHY04_00655 [Candidatus ainarchaeum sp.]|jgi:hypothetical protein|nr:hypothetical protein [Candidatus ainarchaeum sp.]MDD3085691.1 hypothetical protein [Candidatus ainarchaeum sp.]MDD4128228.1 hypothetical protein [Candidatus ainarchaeum sp.]MDD4468267.1 hypothetical protein [Candidatus ainarchaeum sp.]
MVFKRSIVLHGGRKPRRVLSINPKKLLHKGYYESSGLFDVEVTVANKKGRTKKLNLVEKKFFPCTEKEVSPNIRNPIGHLRTVQSLSELNRREKLGLNILPTVRLKKNKNAPPSLIVTKLKNLVEYKNLKGTDKTEVDLKLKHIKKVLWKHGYNRHSDFFLFERNPLTGRITIWVADFGNLVKRKNIAKMDEWLGTN